MNEVKGKLFCQTVKITLFDSRYAVLDRLDFDGRICFSFDYLSFSLLLVLWLMTSSRRHRLASFYSDTTLFLTVWYIFQSISKLDRNVREYFLIGFQINDNYWPQGEKGYLIERFCLSKICQFHHAAWTPSYTNNVLKLAFLERMIFICLNCSHLFSNILQHFTDFYSQSVTISIMI